MILKLKVWLLKKLLSDVAKKGIEGDTKLAHINEWEDKLLKSCGGEGSINPKTGLVQYKGGGGSSQTTTQNIDPAILPYITYGLDEAKTLYEDSSPEYYPDATYVPASDTTTQALNLAGDRARAGSPLIPQGQQTISNMQRMFNPALSGYKALQGRNITTGTNEALDAYRSLQGGIPSGALAGTQATASGDYLSAGNPYFSQMMASAAQPAVNEFNKAIRDIGSRAAASGRYGSGAMGEMESQASENLANALTNRAAELGYSNYGAERGRQEQAIARLGDISNQQFNQQLAATQGLGSIGESQLGREMSAQQNTFANQLAATQGLGSLTEAQAQRQMNAALSAPQMAAADYQDINQLAKVGQTQEDYARKELESDIQRFEFEQNKPYNKLQSYLSAAYGAPAPVNTTTTSSGGGK